MEQGIPQLGQQRRILVMHIHDHARLAADRPHSHPDIGKSHTDKGEQRTQHREKQPTDRRSRIHQLQPDTEPQGRQAAEQQPESAGIQQLLRLRGGGAVLHLTGCQLIYHGKYADKQQQAGKNSPAPGGNQ